jgi:hypothetical protein
MKWKRATDLSVLLPAPSEAAVARLTEVSRRNGITLEGACGFLWGDFPLLHVLASHERTRDLIEEEGFDVRAEQEVLVLDSDDQQSLLERVATWLACSGVRLDILYMTPDGGVVIGVDDVHRAESALTEWIDKEGHG